MASRKWRGRGGIGETENGGAGERAYSPLNTRKYAKGRRRYCNGLVVIGGGAKCMWILTQRKDLPSVTVCGAPGPPLNGRSVVDGALRRTVS